MMQGYKLCWLRYIKDPFYDLNVTSDFNTLLYNLLPLLLIAETFFNYFIIFKISIKFVLMVTECNYNIKAPRN